MESLNVFLYILEFRLFWSERSKTTTIKKTISDEKKRVLFSNRFLQFLTEGCFCQKLKRYQIFYFKSNLKKMLFLFYSTSLHELQFLSAYILFSKGQRFIKNNNLFYRNDTTHVKINKTTKWNLLINIFVVKKRKKFKLEYISKRYFFLFFIKWEGLWKKLLLDKNNQS
jgi:hypothetical protein